MNFWRFQGETQVARSLTSTQRIDLKLTTIVERPFPNIFRKKFSENYVVTSSKLPAPRST